MLIWDTLFGVNDQLQPQPQMVTSYGSSPDFKVWTFTLVPASTGCPGASALTSTASSVTSSPMAPRPPRRCRAARWIGWKTPFTDLIPMLKGNNRIAVDIADPLGNIGSFRINHLYPPFSDVRARHAVQIALSQDDYMGAVVGNEEALWRTLPGFFTPDTAGKWITASVKAQLPNNGAHNVTAPPPSTLLHSALPLGQA